MKDRPNDPLGKPGNRAGRGMIDLPLRPGEAGPSPPDRPGGRAPSGGAKVPRRRERGRRGWPWILIALLLVAAALWWLFWPAPPRISVDRATLSFATVRVGEAGEADGLVISNAGERALRVEALELVGAAAADFGVRDEDCRGRPLAPGDSCAVMVTYAPIEAGRREAALEVRGNAGNSPLPIALVAGAVAPRVGLAPESVDFGSIEVGAAAVDKEITISNVGSARLELGRIDFGGPQAAEFGRDRRCPDTTLEPGEACRLELSFAPAAAGPRRAELVIASDAPGGDARLPLAGTGLWKGSPLEAQPATVDFGEQRVDRRSAPRAVRLVNRAAASVEIVSIELEQAARAFELAADRCSGGSVDSGGACEVSLAVEPGAEGRLGAGLRVAFFGGELVVPVEARGVAPELTVLTPKLDFGALRAGFESAPRQAAFKNTGSATVKISNVRLAGPGADGFVLTSDCRGATIRPGRACEVGVAFRPGSAGDHLAEVRVEPADGLPTLGVELRGRGIVAGLAVEPGRLEWPAVQIGRQRTAELVLTNTGSARLEIGGLRFEGAGATDFGVGEVGCRLDTGLEPAASCRLSLVFSPTADGRRTAELEIAHNGDGSPMRVALAGDGETPKPVFDIGPSDLGFGTAAVGRASEIATLTIRNLGGAWMRLERVRIAGENAADFQLVAGTCDGVTSLAPGGSCTVGVRFTPTATGRRLAVIEVRHGAAGSPAVVSLAGIGG